MTTHPETAPATPNPPPGAEAGLRMGPRPLPLHMAVQSLIWLSSLAALSGLKNGSLPWRPGLKKAAAKLQKSLEAADPDGFFFAAAVDAEARRRLQAFTEGVTRYRHHPRTSRPAEPPVFWRDGATRMLDYGAVSGTGTKSRPPADEQSCVLVVPSLINRGYILDLTEKRSLLRHLAADGLRPFLLDWGVPGADERGFGLTDYVCRRLEPAIDQIFAATGRAPLVVGYCMGGLLTLALATRRPERVAALALLATPWDFHAAPPEEIRLMKAMTPGLTAMIDQLGELPVDVIQAMFASPYPFLTAEKFRRFAAFETGSRKAHQFVALEDWLNDGVPLVGPAARECLVHWYGENAPAEGTWRIGGQLVLATEVRAPTLVVIPEKDHIVPPGSAAALAEAIPGAVSKTLPAGHIGMVAGGRARSILYEPLSRWLKGALTEINQ